ncbi:MAG TPA: sigma-70 family RNA polymerase sigma factor [Candidatus Polarisedimenticolaceae bacterium]|nr:sigma-70 family RNA polymerase sigma factor [Candidatus Polarisedimenticolaceae bacterium]
MSEPTPQERRDEFEEVALPHLDALFNLALNLTRNRKDAEDLVQETYLRAYRFFDSFQPGTQIKAWLFRILRNTFINRYRAAKARPDEVDFARIDGGFESQVDDDYLRSHGPPDPEQALMTGVPDETIRQAMAELPEEYRTVVLMALLEEMSYKEIAAALAIPLGTVMSRLHRGRRHLRRALHDYARRRGIIRDRPGVFRDGIA